MISSKELETLFMGMYESLIITDQSGLIDTANDHAVQMLGMSEEDLKGRHIHALLTPRQKDIRIKEISHNQGSGPIMWHLEWLKSVHDHENDSSTFLAAMTHEIRTPMNGIIGMTDLALEEELTPQIKEYLDVIHLSADSLMRVINDILDYSKIESGKLAIEEIPIQFHDFLDKIIKLFTPQVKAKGLEFRYNPAADIPETIMGDPVRIRQVIQNLLNNALKFTSEGYIELSSCMDTDTNPPRIYFYIADSGIGIPLDKQHLLFRSFTQVDASTTRKYGGTGLGLAICAYLCNAMGGQIDVRSEENKGSTFRFFLPLNSSRESSQNKVEINKSLSLDQDNRNKLILLAEDNRVNQLLAVRTMEKAGYKVICAESGEEAVAKYKAQRPDLILMDIQMPDKDGYEATAEIRELEKDAFKKTPIIALTALALHEDREKILKAGINDFLGKPVSPIDLKEMLHKYCR